MSLFISWSAGHSFENVSMDIPVSVMNMLVFKEPLWKNVMQSFTYDILRRFEVCCCRIVQEALLTGTKQ